MTKSMLTPLAGIAASAAALMVPAAAQAQSASVRFNPYELATSAGSKAVFERIGRAARGACRREAMPLRFYARKSCEANLTDQIVAKIGHPLVAALATPPLQLASRKR